MSSRSLDDLNPATRLMAIEHTRLCKGKGITLLIYCTKREDVEQTALYAIGRTVKGRIVTNARAGESAHNPNEDDKASAYDAVPLLHGKPIWDTKDPTWAIVGALGEDVGLVWSGRWTGKLRESAHFQSPTWVKPK